MAEHGAAGARARRWPRRLGRRLAQSGIAALLGLVVLPALAAPSLPALTAPPLPAGAGQQAARRPLPAAAGVVDFVAFGDMPYDRFRSIPAYRHLIGLINAVAPRVAIHVGDFKDGLGDCSDAVYAEQAAFFDLIAGALVYTPGDNDWFDCARLGDDPLQRLAALRQRFFARPQSLGRQPIAVERQSDLQPEHAIYRENLRWQQQQVLFVTFHTVGPDDGADVGNDALRAESRARRQANIAWLRDSFAQATRRGARALVLATQAGMLEGVRGDRSGWVTPAFEGLWRDALRPLLDASPLPVLLVHGDGHHFHFDQPLRGAAHPLPRLWRLEVPGDPRLHAVKVSVDPDARPPRAPFRVETIWNPMSLDPKLR